MQVIDHQRRTRLVAQSDSAEERRARAVAQRTSLTRHDSGPLTAATAERNVLALSDAGRQYFTPLVGSDPVSRVRLHVGGRADRLAGLARATALTHRDDVFVPGIRFRPETAAGHALLAHELAHVAERPTSPAKVFRQSTVEPHYPTEEEQDEIEKAMSREFGGTTATAPKEQTPPTGVAPPAGAARPAATRGRSLTQPEIEGLVDRLVDAFSSTLGQAEATAPKAPQGVVGSDEAFEIALSARKAVYDKFGAYARQVTLTRDDKRTVAERKAAGEVLVRYGAVEEPGRKLAATIIDTDCEECRTALADLDEVSRAVVRARLLERVLQLHGPRLDRVGKLIIGGVHQRYGAQITMIPSDRKQAYQTAVHEFIHALAHPVFAAVFGNEKNVNEGFTEYFTRQVVKSHNYETMYQHAVAVRSAMSGPFVAPRVFGDAAEESMRLAYFKGRLELIGWQPSGRAEQLAATAAGGSAEWSPQVARTYEAAYRAQARAAQAASRNVLGVGLLFSSSGADPRVSVRYARVLARTEPYARGQLLAEGELLGSPTSGGTALGASLGIAAEYQEPWFYLGGGLRFTGTAAPSGGKNRLDVTPFVGGGVRLWQVVRVGGEGFLLLPAAGEGVRYGGGLRVGIEFD
jgi:Domain of unknown function (DUF4157)